MYHRRSIRSRAVTTGCTGHATVNTPNRRDLQICGQTTRKYSPEICDRAYGDHRVSTGVKSARSWVFPVDRDVSGRERSACVPLSHAHARSRSQGWECRNVTFSPVCWQDTRTWKPGIVGIWVQRQWLFLRNILLLFYGILSQ